VSFYYRKGCEKISKNSRISKYKCSIKTIKSVFESYLILVVLELSVEFKQLYKMIALNEFGFQGIYPIYDCL